MRGTHLSRFRIPSDGICAHCSMWRYAMNTLLIGLNCPSTAPRLNTFRVQRSRRSSGHSRRCAQAIFTQHSSAQLICDFRGGNSFCRSPNTNLLFVGSLHRDNRGASLWVSSAGSIHRRQRVKPGRAVLAPMRPEPGCQNPCDAEPGRLIRRERRAAERHSDPDSRVFSSAPRVTTPRDQENDDHY